MAEERKVFSSSIIRSNVETLNNYKDILHVEPAKPVVVNKTCVKSCNYEPKNDKIYAPKKKTGFKVQTVRDIRRTLEKDVYSYLLQDLELQQNYLLRKIRLGCLKEPKFRSAAKKMLSEDSPMTRIIWRILMNINPCDKAYPTQFVLWNGKNIKVNGSCGGNNKFIQKFDISKTKYRQKISAVSTLGKKKSLLQSLHIKFKPGPLSKKKFLDTSYQKQNFGDLELVRLPKPGLEVQPTYGKPIPPAISSFVYESFLDYNSNKISENWANYALSVLGTCVKGTPVQSKENSPKTYDLSYKCSQNSLLMRRDNEKNNGCFLTRNNTETKAVFPEASIQLDVKNAINEILGAVEISLEQDKMYTVEDETTEYANEESSITSYQPKDNKAKKRHNCELNRLDVTVIRISKNLEEKPRTCTNTYCNLGCICDSLSCKYNIKGHCGRIECMFKCSCDFSGYQIQEYLEGININSYLPEIVSKEKTCSFNLAKEEKKFHQTVILTEDKSIVLKSRKRDSKTTKRYAGFYSHNMRLKNEKSIEKELYVLVNKLNCKNIEPFCLVHNLYRCFCKGKFTSTSLDPVEEVKNSTQIDTLLTTEKAATLNVDKNIEDEIIKIDNAAKETPELNTERPIRSLRIKSRLAAQSISTTSTQNEIAEISDITCARIEPYLGRNYTNSYYTETNNKIKEMEMNDKTLQKKLEKSIAKNRIDGLGKSGVLNQTGNKSKKITSLTNPTSVCEKAINLEENVEIVRDSPTHIRYDEDTQTDVAKSLNNKFAHKSKLISWLETSYKQYKRKAELGIVNSCLGPPQPGKMALYPWDFILSRYRERKNFFLITNEKPYRLFMTVNENNQFFNSSININNIPWSDIDKYPVTIKNLLTNATDIRDSFFILFGLTHSWELVGSVTKVSESPASTDKNSAEGPSEVLRLENILKNYKQPVQPSQSKEENKKDEQNDTSKDYSKWFVMTVENDFSEIQFFKKGFFVKYDSVMKAIHVSRASKKTVRLSSQKCTSKQSDPQFGIYAIPNEKDCCVFIGPYEKDEKLGIETINTTTDPKRKRTRGIWITTDKIDNLKVIDNPLSFMPASSSNSEIPLHESLRSNINENADNQTSSSQPKNVKKVLKPIRIGKTNGFYHLSSDGIFHEISHRSPAKSLSNRTSLSDDNSGMIDSIPSSETENKTPADSVSGIFKRKAFNKPIAEIAPQVKSSTSKAPVKRKLEGMFVLKPEEINKRSFEMIQCSTSDPSPTGSTDINFDSAIDTDIENFLASYAVQPHPKEDVYEISDDDEEPPESPSYNWKYQYIICKNIKSLGWIHGRRDAKNRLSFEFPGFKETDFYPENEAFNKINQVLSRKVYVPKSIIMEWCTVDDRSQIDEREKLQCNELTADYIMTKKGLCHKSDIIKNIKLSQTSSESTESDVERCINDASKEPAEMKSAIMKELEDASLELEDESDMLLNETMSQKESFLSSLDLSEEVKKKFSEKLQKMFHGSLLSDDDEDYET